MPVLQMSTLLYHAAAAPAAKIHCSLQQVHGYSTIATQLIDRLRHTVHPPSSGTHYVGTTHLSNQAGVICRKYTIVF